MKPEIMLNKNNFLSSFRNTAKTIREKKPVFLDLVFEAKKPPNFSRIKPVLYHLINSFEDKTSIIFLNLPYCIMPDAEDHIINLPSDQKIKPEACEGCRFNNFCGGFPKEYFDLYPTEAIKPAPDIPREVSIELTNACNLDCEFCFNKSFYEEEYTLDKNQVENIIDQAKKMGIKIIRFTGGEPFLIEDLNSHINHARRLGLKVWLNTNGTLPEKLSKPLISGIESILVPIHGHNSSSEARITGKRDSFRKKLESIRRIKKFKTQLRVGTIINENNSKNLLVLHQMIKKLGVGWELYRIMGIRKEDLNKPGDFQTLYSNLLKIYKKEGKRIFVANAFPFCFFENPDKARLFSLGGFLDDGRDRIVIDSRGRAKSTYYSRNIAGSWKNLKKAWNNETMKKLRILEYLPKECKHCKYKTICRGGSRIMAKNISGDYCAKDPLLDSGDGNE